VGETAVAETAVGEAAEVGDDHTAGAAGEAAGADRDRMGMGAAMAVR
jgi:hypothetical protein